MTVDFQKQRPSFFTLVGLLNNESMHAQVHRMYSLLFVPLDRSIFLTKAMMSARVGISNMSLKSVFCV